jgi:uncharacterized protein YndB with AHSA1/START domain
MNTETVKSRVELEFTVNTSPSILYSRLITPSGLSEWFADDVSIKGNSYMFNWNNVQQAAELVSFKENKYVRFRWINDIDNEENYFEFRIAQHELTGETALHVVEILSDDDTEDTISLWNSQIAELKHVLGI